MKNVLRLLAIAALATTFALPALAQDTTGTATTAAASAQDVQAKADLYKKFLENYKGTPDQQKVAYEAGKDYLSKYGSDNSAENAPIVKFISNWIGRYEKAVLEFNCTKAVNETPAQAFSVCRDVLANNPDNLKIHLQLVAAGIKLSQAKDTSHNAEALNEARKALQLIEQGKTSDVWAPFADQVGAKEGLRYYVGFFSLESAPEETAKQLLDIARGSGALSKDPNTYQLLGASYYNGEFKKLAAQYKANYEGKEETPESKALFDRINVVLDRIIDAYARAVALSNGKAQYALTNNQSKSALTTFYKQRHDNSDAGLNELVASVLSRPIPVPGQEPAAAPAPSSSSAVTGTDGTTATKPAAVTTQPTATTTAKPSTTPTGGAKPAATTTPAGVKPTTPAQKPPVSKTTAAVKKRAA
jgi:hypothetical protein